jgi:hypothetical protein
MSFDSKLIQVSEIECIEGYTIQADRICLLWREVWIAIQTQISCYEINYKQ